jgi:hypothetical protein
VGAPFWFRLRTCHDQRGLEKVIISFSQHTESKEIFRQFHHTVLPRWSSDVGPAASCSPVPAVISSCIVESDEFSVDCPLVSPAMDDRVAIIKNLSSRDLFVEVQARKQTISYYRGMEIADSWQSMNQIRFIVM